LEPSATSIVSGSATLGNSLLVRQTEIDFDAPAVLRKLPSIKGQPAQHVDWPGPYLIFDGSLRECIQQFFAKPEGQRHLYEIHTAPQGDIIKRVMKNQEIARLASQKETS
jgi:hypothetical protein